MFRNKAPSQGPLSGPTVDVQLLAHPVRDLVLRRKTEDGLGRDSTALQALCPAVLTLMPLDLGPDLSLHPRKDISPVAQEVDPAPHPAPIGPLPLSPALLLGGEGTPTLPLALALGVAQGHAPSRLRDDLSGTRAGDCTDPHAGQLRPTTVTLQG